ncbi:MAG: hypothetical protein IJZ35_03980 [Clostridia bacterium]|nr:hypothetical protein [Clostridia bacterium]
MIELSLVFSTLATELDTTMKELGFAPDIPDGIQKGDTPVFIRDKATYLSYSGDKGKIRVLFNDNKIRLLTGDKEAKSIDDSDYTLLGSFLLVLDEYEIRDVKSVANEIKENLTEAFSPKQIAKRQQAIKAQATVSRAAVKNGSLLYDPATLAIRLATLYPQLKDEYKDHLAVYDEFLCEDFFVNNVNPLVFATIKESNPQKMKKLFNILNEIFDDGTNEVQDVIIVTMLASYNYDDVMYQSVLGYINDSIMEPFIKVYKKMNRGKSTKMRLENPPKYKIKKQKKKKSAFQSVLNQ